MKTSAIEFNSRRYVNMSLHDMERIDTAIDLVGTGKTVLDVGCMDGTISTRIASRSNSVYGVDASAPAIDRARRRGIDAVVADLEDGLPYPNDSFDVIFAGEIIEHVFDIDLLFLEFNRVLRDGGELVITTPNLASLGRRLMLLIGKNPNIEISFTGNAAGHIRYLVRDDLLKLLKDWGFKPDVITSDVVNFNREGTHKSVRLAKRFPSLGRSLIVKARKMYQLSN